MVVEDNHLKILKKKLGEIRKIFFSEYPKLRKTQIITEQFTQDSLPIPFFISKEILNELYFLIKGEDEKNIIKRIKQMFLFAQFKSLLYALGEIYSNPQKYLSNRNIQKLRNIREERIKKCARLGLSPNLTIEDIFNRVGENMHLIEEINDLLIKEFLEIIRFFIPGWDPYSREWESENFANFINGEENSPLTDINFLQRLIKLMTEEYIMSRRVIIDINARRGIFFRPSITEYRDALDHVVKSFFLPPQPAIRELDFASEHLRRAAVETIQDYVTSRLEERFSILFTHQLPEKDRQRLLKKLFIATNEVCVGRYLKGTQDWYFSIYHFYKALNSLLEGG